MGQYLYNGRELQKKTIVLCFVIEQMLYFVVSFLIPHETLQKCRHYALFFHDPYAKKGSWKKFPMSAATMSR